MTIKQKKTPVLFLYVCVDVNIDPLCSYVLIYTFLYDASVCVCVFMHTNLLVLLTSQSTLHTAEGKQPAVAGKSDCFSISILMSRFVKSPQERKKITGSS